MRTMSDFNADPWHFHRRELAERTVLALTKGPTKALTLFAPRRKGKTEFLRKDLTPAAEKEGHVVVYISFWDPLEPLALLVDALEQAVARKTITGKAGAAVRRITPKLKLSAKLPGTGAGGEIDLSQIPPETRTSLVAHVDTLLGRLEKPKRKTILLLDEVQELARRERDEGLVAALRTSLDVRSDGLSTVFTGSSREGLRTMFSASKAPFFHFGSQFDLEPLGDEFVDHLIARVLELNGTALDREVAIEAYRSLGRSPYHFRALIEDIVLRPDLSIEDALVAYRRRLAAKQGYDTFWLGLKPLHRALLGALATEYPPFGAEASAMIESETGKEPAKSTVQRALASLADQGIIDRWDGDWRFADDELRIWLSAERV
ncbi:hypothetical protein HK107_14655 [Parvularcula sp. ZS-1/3]|uniref:ATP-binding protein n=1 Tax=Parvularcula mediterranea TaxID=2732508 RepID=A0A7Y3RNY0_9PROT|nr:hypothetical protein [Parvularcula mediterranea]NNU17569.1 hypothetical protein [Parvularcula mediterranea]